MLWIGGMIVAVVFLMVWTLIHVIGGYTNDFWFGFVWLLALAAFLGLLWAQVKEHQENQERPHGRHCACDICQERAAWKAINH